MDTQNTYVKRIRQAYPDLEIIDSRLSPIRTQINDIFIVNEEVLFRFPRHEEDAQAVLREAAVLKALKNHLSLPIPEPIYISVDPEKGGGIFFGYRMIAGEPLSKQILDMHRILTDEANFRQVVTQMASFVDELHRVPLESLGVELPRAETRQDVWNLYQGVKEELSPQMRPDAAEWVKRIFENFLGDEHNFAYQPVVRHGHLIGSNILFDPATGSVSGVLDFSGVALGDPAVDVAGLASISEPFFSFLYEMDPEKIGPLMHRAQFYKSTFALQQALMGLREGDSVAFDRGMLLYRSSELVGQLDADPRVA